MTPTDDVQSITWDLLLFADGARDQVRGTAPTGITRCTLGERHR